MGAFIVVIIMLVYILGRCGIESSERAYYNKEYEEKKGIKNEAYEEFKRKCTDPVLEKRVREDKAIREETRKMLMDSDLMGIPTDNQITLIAMARHGKVPMYMTEKVIFVGNYWYSQKFMAYYATMLRQNGMPYEPKLCIRDFGTEGNKYFSVYDTEHQRYAGHYSWPEVFDVIGETFSIPL